LEYKYEKCVVSCCFVTSNFIYLRHLRKGNCAVNNELLEIRFGRPYGVFCDYGGDAVLNVGEEIGFLMGVGFDGEAVFGDKQVYFFSFLRLFFLR
jgi:hypothetical protein